MRIYSVSVFFLGPILIVPFGLLLFALPYGFSFRDIRTHDPSTTLRCVCVHGRDGNGLLLQSPLLRTRNLRYHRFVVDCIAIAYEAGTSLVYSLPGRIPLACVIALAIRASAGSAAYSRDSIQHLLLG